MPADDLRDLVEQLEAGRAELLDVCVRLAHRLRLADPDSAEKAAKEIQVRRSRLRESRTLETRVTTDALAVVVKALRGEK